MDPQFCAEKGYLLDSHKVFCLDEMAPREIEYHYHSFDKLLLFLSGNVDYTIGGRTYSLMPEDIVLVPRGEPHRVSVRDGEGYSRMVIYLSPEKLMEPLDDGRTLRDCFLRAEESQCHVVRDTGDRLVWSLVPALKHTVTAPERDGFSRLYQTALLQQLLIALNRGIAARQMCGRSGGRQNEKLVELIRYINAHLTEDLSIDDLSQRFFLSKYHMMRIFKEKTGYTIGGYITQKRLLRARELLQQGEPVTRACLDAGFRDHSTFIRAYKKAFGETPSRTAGGRSRSSL